MTPNPRDTPTGSPCIGVCSATSLGDLICRGCGRTKYEVDNWNTFDDATKIMVKEVAAKRKAQGPVDFDYILEKYPCTTQPKTP